MFHYIWPVGLVVLCNTVYQLCAKSVPQNMDPFASLTVTYIIAAAVSAVLYMALNHGGDFAHEYAKLNWASVVLGIVIVGLEVGVILAYKAGWQVSTFSTVQFAFLAVVLLGVGWLAFKESLSFNKVVGVFICLIGLVFINKS